MHFTLSFSSLHFHCAYSFNALSHPFFFYSLHFHFLYHSLHFHFSCLLDFYFPIFSLHFFHSLVGHYFLHFLLLIIFSQSSNIIEFLTFHFTFLHFFSRLGLFSFTYYFYTFILSFIFYIIQINFIMAIDVVLYAHHRVQKYDYLPCDCLFVSIAYLLHYSQTSIQHVNNT